MRAPRNSPKTPKTGNPGPEIPRAPYKGAGKNGGNFRGASKVANSPCWQAPQTAYITHAHTCPTCTDANRWPGGDRCPAGAAAWAAYLLALPDLPPLPSLSELPDLAVLPELSELPELPDLQDLPDPNQDRAPDRSETEPHQPIQESDPS